MQYIELYVDSSINLLASYQASYLTSNLASYLATYPLICLSLAAAIYEYNCMYIHRERESDVDNDV